MGPSGRQQMPMTPLDHQRLQEALQLAEGSFGLCDPNPRVGCILGTSDGRIFGRGATQVAGGAHAEVMALRDAQGQHQSLVGATAWVTLEPCAHHGRTPPCCDALIEAGIGRVVVALADPYSRVNGSGISRLRAAGVEVEVASGSIAAAAADINIGFLSRVLRDRPWVRLKVAASLDGKTALANGQSQWITHEAARLDGHRWRHRASAVLTGIGTVRSDDPRLDARGADFTSQPLRVVLDSGFSLPIGARLLQPPGSVLIVGATDLGSANPALKATAAELISLPSPEGRVDLRALLQELGRRGVNELHVEAGAALNGALLQGGWVDEVLLYLAPTLLGPGRSMFELPALQTLGAAPKLELVSIGRCGPDIALRLQTSVGVQFRLGRLGESAPSSTTFGG
jgi:diaminohydroxyphosphoribosylaminopyrimidine deaminase/5-amino-6-(5-phosphoribosylamino)uracil reductase